MARNVQTANEQFVRNNYVFNREAIIDIDFQAFGHSRNEGDALQTGRRKMQFFIRLHEKWIDNCGKNVYDKREKCCAFGGGGGRGVFNVLPFVASFSVRAKVYNECEIKNENDSRVVTYVLLRVAKIALENTMI